MPRIKLEQPEVKDTWDLKDPEVRRIVRNFQRELEEIRKDPEKSVYAFEWWCLQNGHFYKPTIIKKEFEGRVHLKPEPLKVNININDAWGRRDALKRLLNMEEYAKSINEPPPQDYV